MVAKRKPIKTPELDEFNNSKVARYLAGAIDLSGVSQKDISRQIGYTKPNIITMFKQGLTRLPLEKVGPMADALGVDPMRLMRLCMEEYFPQAWESMQSIIGFAVTQNEMDIIEAIREATNEEDPAMRTAEARKKLRLFAKELI